jgi:hypothetical protein
MEGQSVSGSLLSIADCGGKYNGNGLKITVFDTLRRPTGTARLDVCLSK